MDFTSAAQWLDEVRPMIRSYVKTRNLEELAARDPKMAEQVEALCRAVLALRGFALLQQANGVLNYAAKATEPFVEMSDAFDLAMAAKASVAQARSAVARRKVGGA